MAVKQSGVSGTEKAKMVLQAELRALLKICHAYNWLAYSIAQRLHAGAEVEPGELDAVVEDPHVPPEPEGWIACDWLQLGRREHIEEVRALRARRRR